MSDFSAPSATSSYSAAVNTIFGLPAHPMFVHLAVVLVPLTALVAIVVVVWPKARGYLGVFPPVLALAALIVVPLTTSAGEALEHSLPSNDDIERHADLGDKLILFVGPLFALVVIWWALFSPLILRRLTIPVRVRRPLVPIVGVVTVALAVATLVMVILVGHSGSYAVWNNP